MGGVEHGFGFDAGDGGRCLRVSAWDIRVFSESGGAGAGFSGARTGDRRARF
jgi:hypothetical protein